MSMAGLSRVSLVSALNANPNTVMTLPSSVLKSSVTMLQSALVSRARAGNGDRNRGSAQKQAAPSRKPQLLRVVHANDSHPKVGDFGQAEALADVDLRG
jgi:hypothetical protein